MIFGPGLLSLPRVATARRAAPAAPALTGMNAVVDALAVDEWVQQATITDIRAVLQARTLANFDEATILGSGTSAFANDAAVETSMGTTAAWHPADFSAPLIYAATGTVLYPPRGGHGGKEDSCFITVDAATGTCARVIDGSGMRAHADGPATGSLEYDAGGTATSLFAGVRKADHTAGDDDRNAFLPAIQSQACSFVAGSAAYIVGDSAALPNGDHTAPAVYKFDFLTNLLSVHLTSATTGSGSTTKRGWHSDSANRLTVYDATDTGAGDNDRVLYVDSNGFLVCIMDALAGTTTHPDNTFDTDTGPGLVSVSDATEATAAFKGRGAVIVQPTDATKTMVVHLGSDGSGSGSSVGLFTGIKPKPFVKATDRNTASFSRVTTANDPATMRVRGRSPGRRPIIWDSENSRFLVWDGGAEINVLTPSSGITTWTWSELASAGGDEPNITVDSGTGYDYMAMELIPDLANNMRAVICATDEGVWVRRLA